MKILNLFNQEGNYESNPSGRGAGYRTFGVWSYNTLNIGDLIAKKAVDKRGPTVHQILSIRKDFTGSDGNKWWKGEMVDINRLKLWTPEIIGLTNQALRAYAPYAHLASD